ncbi:MAG: four helix bundle protein [Candidatus Doudnabacteria bacterium]|nr:four helix bundle protein [Candidatus Doudnabacteria bacterium]
MENSSKIRTFRDLKTWQSGHQLVLTIYKATKTFPKDEMFGLISQLRRAGVSFTSNLAEGFSRRSYKEKVQFYCTSLGSLTEIQNQLLIARDIGYLEAATADVMLEQTEELHKMTNGLIKSSKEFYK